MAETIPIARPFDDTVGKEIHVKRITISPNRTDSSHVLNDSGLDEEKAASIRQAEAAANAQEAKND